MKQIIFLFLASLTLAPYSFAALAPSEGFSGNISLPNGGFTANSKQPRCWSEQSSISTDLMSSGNTKLRNGRCFGFQCNTPLAL
ncbi:hypothetical protein OK016_15230 [Vibrio chagasii]|nr:hypothetical protein [Vibrio chagasii]